jgi:hypothetical protein
MPKHLTVNSQAEVAAISPIPSSTLTLIVDIDNNVKGYGLKTIDNDWQKDQTTLKGLSIGQGVTSIGNHAFNNCIGLTGNLVIPNSVTTIGSLAFNNCPSFTGLVIPNSVTTIGSYAFGSCTGFIGKLVIPNSVTNIGSYAFYDCTGLTGNFVIPNSVTSIGSHAFTGCTFLTSVDCYVALTVIGTNAFQGSNIATINVIADDASWTAGPGQTIGGESGITVNKIL